MASWTKILVRKLEERRVRTYWRKLELTCMNVDRSGGSRESVAKAIRRGRVGLKDPEASDWFLLIPGTYRCRQNGIVQGAGRQCSAKEDAMIRVDMSEYMEKHSVSKNDRFTSGLCRI